MGVNDKIDKRIKVINQSRHFRISRGGSKYEDGGYEYQVLVDGIDNMLIKIPKLKKGRYQIHIDFEIIKEKFDILYSLIKNINEKDITKKKKNICSVTLSDTGNEFENFITILDEFFENNIHNKIELANQDKLIDKDIIQNSSDQHYKLEIDKKGNIAQLNQELRTKEIYEKLEIYKKGNIIEINRELEIKGRKTKLEDIINYDIYDGYDPSFENILNSNIKSNNIEDRHIYTEPEQIHISHDNDQLKEDQQKQEKQNSGMAVIDAVFRIIRESITNKLETNKQNVLALPSAGRHVSMLPPANCETLNKDSRYSTPGEKVQNVLSKKLNEHKNYNTTENIIHIMAGSYLSYIITIPQGILSAHLYENFTASGDIETFITDEYSFFNWKNGLQFSTRYFSGRVTVGNINMNLLIGKNYIVYSNIFDTLSDKSVRISVNVRYK